MSGAVATERELLGEVIRRLSAIEERLEKVEENVWLVAKMLCPPLAPSNPS